MNIINRLTVLGALASILLPFSVLEQGARADTEPPRVVLTPAARDLVVGPGMNAAGKDIRGCEFVGQDLTGANFDGCNLYGVWLENCILKDASFRRAVFTGACLSTLLAEMIEGADFTDATMNGVRLRFRYDSVELSPEQFMSTRSYKTKDLHQCVINGSWEPVAFDFRGADLREAWIVNGDFTKADFANARVCETTFQSVRLAFEQLASTLDFKQRSLHVRFEGGGARVGLLGKWGLSGVNLEGSYIGAPPDADFTDAIINGCTLTLDKAQLSSTRSYREGNLSGLRVMRGNLSGFDLSRMNLTGCFFSHCKFAGTNFEDAVITGAWFVTDESIAESDQLSVEQIKSTWNYKHNRMEGIILPEKLAETLKQEQEAKP